MIFELYLHAILITVNNLLFDYFLFILYSINNFILFLNSLKKILFFSNLFINYKKKLLLKKSFNFKFEFEIAIFLLNS